MLKNIHPLLNADILHALRQMGHGDDLVMADTNFPSDSIALQTAYGKVLRMDCDAATAVKALLTQFPLDTFVGHAATRMEVVGEPETLLPVHSEVELEVMKAEGETFKLGSVERFAFYERAKKAFCVIQTGERRFYGCFIFKMGVVPPEKDFA